LNQSRATACGSVTVRVEIGVAPAVVWKALTDPVELGRWFALEAECSPGVGGHIRISWGGPYNALWRITAWEPGHRLRMIEIDALGGVRNARTQRGSSAPSEGISHSRLEFLLEGDEAHTALTLTHARFAAGVNSNSTAVLRRGWEFELRSLRHYLEFHFGLPREVVWVKQMARDVAADIWDRIIPLLLLPATSPKWHQAMSLR
jgi:uncharacterized protein YndB with AHSA1/START domain